MNATTERELSPYIVRIRIAHSFTAKSGWRGETTVELTGNANDPVDVEQQLESWLRKADDLARAESRTRNTIDGVSDQEAA